MGPALTAENMKVSIKEAKEIIETFYDSFPKVKEFVENNEKLAVEKGFVEDAWGRKRRLSDAQLPEYEIFRKKFKEDFNPLFDSGGFIYEDDSKLIVNYMKQLENCRSLKEKQEVKEQAKKVGIEITDNGGFISKAKRQATNARIQGCLSYDTKISTKEYGITNIGAITGQRLHVWDGEDWSIANITSSGLKQKCLITLSTGQVITCSPNHQFKIKKLIHDTTNKCTKNVDKFIKCSDLKPNDKICISGKYGIADSTYSSNPTILKAPNQHNYSLDMITNHFHLGRLLGRLASDGSFSVRETGGSILDFMVAEHEFSIIEELLNNLPFQYTTRDVIRENRNQILKHIYITSKLLATEVSELDIKHTISDKIFSDTELLRGFISGFFDGDGGIMGNNITLTFGLQYNFEPMCRLLQKALLFFGISSSFRKFKNCYRIIVSKKFSKRFAKTIGFLNPDKQLLAEDMDTKYDNHCYGIDTVTIQSIEITNDYIDMYDVCDTERGYFVADGVIVHNSASTMTKKAMINIYNDKEMNDLGFKLLIGVHDELIGECPEENAEACGERLGYLMAHAAEDEVKEIPFKCDAEIENHWYANTYSHTIQKEYKDYMNNGMTEEEAKEKLFNEHCECTSEQLEEYLSNTN